ncbi:MAG: large conductance mechanosensitive channel protein MscL [Flavobacteriaceae bacterium]|nr:large conductance mechanosensitive channel protein MscL [Flavobacteriaceae bacterium]PHX76976.1 MAG: large conductance mechanosensitive channel protein MscL [Flavobacteriales bacterium]
MIKEFKEFVNRGNVMDLAIAVIIGTAFQNIVNSIVNDLIMPLIALLGGWAKLDDLRLGPFNYGKLVANILHFLIVAFVLFLVVKALNKAKKIIVIDEVVEEKPKVE